ncbi:MAG: sodium:solute symporter family protein [Bryobacteraceae bacterium]
MSISGSGHTLASLSILDVAVIAIYFFAVIAVGFVLKERMRTSEDFFLAGRGMTAWVAGLSFLAANMGALELMGWAASAYQYGLLAAHWYWIGAVPAMIFLALIMMPFYYISKTHSVPGYLKLRYGEPTRALSSLSFAGMTTLMSGINMFAMAKVMQVVLGWDLNFSIWAASLTVAVYVTLGGLTSAILNEVLQFFLIWLGALVIPILGLMECGGWQGLRERILANSSLPSGFLHLWTSTNHFASNPMGVHWTGIVFGLGFVGALGYWTTDFLVIQRVIAAKDLRAAQIAPIIGAAFKLFVPLIVILPGLIGVAVLRGENGGLGLVSEAAAGANQHTYNEVLPLLLVRYAGPGLLGLGITALVAGFMSGMAGNVSAFATVWTYDIYRPLLRPHAGDAHYVTIGRWSTVLGILASVGTAYAAMHFSSIMDYVQALFSFFVTPLFGTVILGMLWKRATPAGGFWGLLVGMGSSLGMWFWVHERPSALAKIALSADAKPMAENLYRMLWSWLACVIVTVVISGLTRPKPETELAGLVYGCTKLPEEHAFPLVQRPAFWGAAVFFVFLYLQWIFR